MSKRAICNVRDREEQVFDSCNMGHLELLQDDSVNHVVLLIRLYQTENYKPYNRF